LTYSIYEFKEGFGQLFYFFYSRPIFFDRNGILNSLKESVHVNKREGAGNNKKQDYHQHHIQTSISKKTPKIKI
jgi:hypothetical protein